jgi:hypothetical protein
MVGEWKGIERGSTKIADIKEILGGIMSTKHMRETLGCIIKTANLIGMVRDSIERVDMTETQRGSNVTVDMRVVETVIKKT